MRHLLPVWLRRRPSAVALAPEVTQARIDKSERRSLTLLFVDIVDSTGLAERLDPESWRDVLREYHEICLDACRTHGGGRARIIGDGLLCYFGFPNADELSPRHALQAALEMRLKLGQRDPAIRARFGAAPTARAGIHTGMVLISDMGSGEARVDSDIVGLTPIVAQRIQALASPGEILISEATAQICGPMFELGDRGVHTLRGVSNPMRVYELVSSRGLQHPFEARTDIPVLVGRVAEREELTDAASRACHGGSAAVLVSGEPGIGKSRLAQWLRGEAQAANMHTVDLYCASGRESDPFHPVAISLARELERRRASGTEEGAIASTIRALGLSSQHAAALAVLVGLEDESLPRPEIAPERLRQTICEALREFVATLSAETPLLLVVEDLHWADPSTLTFLAQLTAAPPVPGLLLFLNARPEGVEKLKSSGVQASTTITLGPLPGVDAAALVDALGARWGLSDETRAVALRRGEGVPFYLEVLTRELAEGDRGAGGASVPIQIEDLLSTRMARLGDARGVLLTASALGRQFDIPLLAETLGVAVDTLQAPLTHCIDAGFLQSDGFPARNALAFTHELVREAAYDMLLASTRRMAHGRAANALERRAEAAGVRDPALLAHHYECAGVIASAVACWEEAAVAAQHEGAHLEAIADATRGLSLVAQFPGEATEAAEVSLQALKAASLGVTAGYSAPETRAAHEAAQAICERSGMTTALLGILSGLTGDHLLTGNVEAAARLAARIVAIARETEDEFETEGLACLGYARFFAGELREAARLLEEANAVFAGRPGGYATHDTRWRLPNTAPIGTLSLLGHARWMLGDESSALEAASLAVKAGPPDFPAGPSSRVFALSYAAWLHNMRGAREEAVSASLACIELAGRHGFREFELAAAVQLWIAQANLGDAAATAQLTQTLAAIAAAGGYVFLSSNYGGLAQAELASGHAQAALVAIEAAEATSVSSGVHFQDAELARLRGEALLSMDPQNAVPAAAALERAVSIAREQGALAFELRAELARGRWATALDLGDSHRDELQRVIDRFPEGATVADLVEARAMALPALAS